MRAAAAPMGAMAALPGAITAPLRATTAPGVGAPPYGMEGIALRYS